MSAWSGFVTWTTYRIHVRINIDISATTLTLQVRNAPCCVQLQIVLPSSIGIRLMWSSGISILALYYPSCHTNVVITLSQRWDWGCHNVVARSKMRVMATSVSNDVTATLYDVAKTLPQRYYNAAKTSTNGCVGVF